MLGIPWASGASLKVYCNEIEDIGDTKIFFGIEKYFSEQNGPTIKLQKVIQNVICQYHKVSFAEAVEPAIVTSCFFNVGDSLVGGSIHMTFTFTDTLL